MSVLWQLLGVLGLAGMNTRNIIIAAVITIPILYFTIKITEVMKVGVKTQRARLEKHLQARG